MKQGKQRRGLDDSQVLANRKLYGQNKLTPAKKIPTWKLLLEKFRDPLIIILLVAMFLSLGVAAYEYFVQGETKAIFLEPLGIAFAVTLAISVSFFFEQSANKKFEVLNKVGEQQPIKAIRNGNYCAVQKDEIVVGDIVLLETGDEIPADGILLEAVQLQVNESALTGEPKARKGVNMPELKDSTYPPDRVMSGTTVIDGHGVMKVTMVGMRTEYGKVYEGAQIENRIKTPLNIQLERLSSIITTFSYIVAGLIIVGRMLNFFLAGMQNAPAYEIGTYVLNTLMLAITLIVVAVPEGLPMSVSLSLALSMRRMLSTNNLVRKMHACETMGSATVICTDKTGTLTQNQMHVSETDFFALGPDQESGSEKSRKLLTASIVANSTANLSFDGQRIRPLGNPTEAALLTWLYKGGIDYRNLRDNYEIADQSAFSTEKKYMATVIKTADESKELLLVKGAPEIIISFCTWVDSPNGIEPYTPERRIEIDQILENRQRRALRTIAFAYKEIDSGTKCFDRDGMLRIKNLVFMGSACITDPIRPEVPEAMQGCLNAGIKVKIVTGDTSNTAIEVARQAGLWTANDTQEKNHISGAEFAATDNDTLLQRISDIKIMSRARPMDKSRLVQLLQQLDEVVAVTGDGTNDAPALNAAQVGLSMGDGTSVAKQASAITIIDNSFRSINRAVLWGRSLFRNIQRFIIFQLIINIVACLVVLVGAFTGRQSPLTVTQMLWVNLIMDTFAAMALASLPPDERVMKEKPRDVKSNIITHTMFLNIICSAVAMFGFFELILYIMKCNDITSASDFFAGNLTLTESNGGQLTSYEMSLFFTIFVIEQFWNLFNAKAFASGGSAMRHLFGSSNFLIITMVVLGGQILITTFGGKMFNVEPLSITDWIIVVVGCSLTLIVGEIIRLIKFSLRK